MEKMEGFDFAREERNRLEGADFVKHAKVLQLVTSRLMENAG